MSAWPNIAWTDRKSAPPCNRCVANEWRSMCGEGIGDSSPLAARARSSFQNPCRVIGVPRRVTNTKREDRVASAGPVAHVNTYSCTSADCRSPDWNHPLFVALARDADISDIEIALIDPKRDQFGHTQTRRIEHFHHRAIATSSGVGRCGTSRRRVTSSMLRVLGSRLRARSAAQTDRRIRR